MDIKYKTIVDKYKSSMTALIVIQLILAILLVIFVLLQGSDNEGLGLGGGGGQKKRRQRRPKNGGSAAATKRRQRGGQNRILGRKTIGKLLGFWSFPPRGARRRKSGSGHAKK